MLKVIKGEDQPILRTVCDPVVDFDSNLKKLATEMVETMNDPKAPGIGIAAPQVGVNARLFVVTLGIEQKKEKVCVMVNPVVVEESDEVALAEEGCLSLPGEYGNVLRPVDVKVEYKDLNGKEFSRNLHGLDARVFLHELDHLNGVLFIDKLVDGVVM
jgi:peptide deformylase